MLTYQLQKRHLLTPPGSTVVFPNDVEIKITCAPSEPFGVPGSGQTRTVFVGHPGKLEFKPSIGKIAGSMPTAPKPIEYISPSPSPAVSVHGPVVTIRSRIESLDDFVRLITPYQYLFPLLLNVEFQDPPTVTGIRGTVGTTAFEWGVTGATLDVETTSVDSQQLKLERALRRLELVGLDSNRRLAAALHYFHVACRLIAVGNSPWEFMAEAILNFSKVLEALFGQAKDDTRREATKFQYSVEEVERYFITMMFLRNEFDVGHVALSLPEDSHRETIYRYLRQAEKEFRKLINRVVEAVEGGHYHLVQEPHFTLDLEKQKLIERWEKNWGSDVKLP